MKTTICTALLLFAALSSWALNFLPGQKSSEPKEGKWSNCIWGNNINYDTANLPQKPGPNDTVATRGGWVFEIDQDVSVASFHMVSSKEVFAKKRTIRTKRSIGGQIPGSNFDSLMNLENCTLENGGIFNIDYWTESRNAGRIEFRFVDTKLSNRGDLSCIVPVNPAVVSPQEPCGVTISLVGDSKLSFSGATIDALFEEAGPWYFKWNFEEKDGKLPYVIFAKRAQFNKCELSLKIDGKFSKGKYTLAEFSDRKSGFKDAKFYVNGETYNLGDTFIVDGKKAKITLSPSPTGRDSKTANDLVLEILK